MYYSSSSSFSGGGGTPPADSTVSQGTAAGTTPPPPPPAAAEVINSIVINESLVETLTGLLESSLAVDASCELPLLSLLFRLSRDSSTTGCAPPASSSLPLVVKLLRKLYSTGGHPSTPEAVETLVREAVVGEENAKRRDYFLNVLSVVLARLPSHLLHQVKSTLFNAAQNVKNKSAAAAAAVLTPLLRYLTRWPEEFVQHNLVKEFPAAARRHSSSSSGRSQEEEDQLHAEAEATIFVAVFDAVVRGRVLVSESLVVETLVVISEMDEVDPVVEILVEWALTEFPTSRDWNALRFTALLIAGIFRLSPSGKLRSELLLLLTLEDLPWHVRLLIGTHLLEHDPFSTTSALSEDDPLLNLVATARRSNSSSNSSSYKPAPLPPPPFVSYSGLTLELVSRLLLPDSPTTDSGMKEFRADRDKLSESVGLFRSRYPWCSVPCVGMPPRPSRTPPQSPASTGPPGSAHPTTHESTPAP